jgi:hypothetical protein
VTSNELIALLQDFYRDKLAMKNRHVAGAAVVPSYEFNNTYQYVVNRDDTHLSWIRAALEALGAPVPDDAPTVPVPSGGKGDQLAADVTADDARLCGAFVARWQPRVASMGNARHQKMLELTLGEVREQQRFFEQMMAGREDLLGRRPANFSTGGGVLPVRWLE